MSNFSVVVTKISSVKKHPQADRLDIVTVEDNEYEMVSLRDAWEVGDLCVYFPIESVLPDNLITVMGLEGKLGKYNGKRNVVETKEIPARTGFYSQGMVWATDIIPDPELRVYGLDVTELLEIKKLEKVEFLDNAGGKAEGIQLGHPLPFPRYVRKYDIENHEKYPQLLETMEKIVVMEKVEGSNCWLSINHEGVTVGQRSGATNPNTEFGRIWIETVKRDFEPFAQELWDKFHRWANCVTLRGEIIGEKIAGGAPFNNYYGIEGKKCYLFDVEVDGSPLDWMFVSAILSKSTSPCQSAPILYEGDKSKLLTDTTIKSYANRMSLINTERMAEGIVIRPTIENSYPSNPPYPNIKRQIVKVVSAEYLAWKGKQ